MISSSNVAAGERSRLRTNMIRLNGHYLYEVGGQMKFLNDISAGVKYDDAFLPLLVAEGALKPFLQQSVFQLRTSQQSGFELLEIIGRLREKAESGKYVAKKAECQQSHAKLSLRLR